MKKKLVCILIAIMFVSILSVPFEASAQGKIDVSADTKGSKMEYSIKNKTESDIDEIQIDEILKDKGGSVVDSSSISGGRIAAGDKAKLVGKPYNSFMGDFNLEYNVRCKMSGSNVLEEIASGSKKLNLSDVRISVSYSAQPADRVQKGSSVTYTAELTSKSNIPIYNIVVIDSVHGELGVIDVLEPEQKKTVSKNFNLSQSVESHVILKFDDPFGVRGGIEQPLYNTKIGVNVTEEVPEPKISIDVKPNKTAIKGSTDVAFNIDVQNTGNVALHNIELTDWDGKLISRNVKLQPGDSYSVQFTGKVEPEKSYEISCIASAEGTDKGAKASYTVKLSKLDPSVEIDRRIVPDSYKIGDTIKLEYIVRNTGNVGLKDIVLEESEWKEKSIGKLDSLDPGEEKVISIKIDLTAPIVSKVILKGYDKVAGEEYKYEAPSLAIGGKEGEASKLDIRLKADPERLDKPGSIILECRLSNKGNGSLKNVEVSIEERGIVLGSLLELPAGSEETMKSMPIDVEETETFRVVVKGINSAGNKVEFTSSPLTVEVGGQKKQDDTGDGRRAILKTVMVVITLLIIFVAGTLIYVVKNPKAYGKGDSIGKPKGEPSDKSDGGPIEKPGQEPIDQPGEDLIDQLDRETIGKYDEESIDKSNVEDGQEDGQKILRRRWKNKR